MECSRESYENMQYLVPNINPPSININNFNLHMYCPSHFYPEHLQNIKNYNFNELLQQNELYNWIIQYLEMSSTTNTATSFYHSIIDSPQRLANGYELIKIFLLQSQQNRTQTLLNLAHPNIPILTLVLNIYPNQIFNTQHITQIEKQQTRAFLVNLIVAELIKKNEAFNYKFTELLFSFLHKIHNIQGFQEWVALYQQALQRLVQNQSDRFGYFILNILKLADDRVNAFSRHILALIIGSDWIPNFQEQLQIIYYSYKSLAVLVESDPEVIEAYVAQSIQPTIIYIMQNMKKSIRGMKFGLKTLTVLLADYQLTCSQEMLYQIEVITQSLVVQYINYLNRGCNSSINTDMQFQEQESDTDSIEIVIYQLLELLLTLYGNQVYINHKLNIYLCIVSLFLSPNQYTRYVSQSDQYTMEIEDQSQQNIRRKAIFFIDQIFQNGKFSKQCKKILGCYINQIITNLNNVNLKVSQFLQTYKLPNILLNVQQIYIQSALVLLYSFTDQLMTNQKQLTMILGNIIQNSAPNSIDSILCLTLLNKLVKKQSESYKQEYLVFLRNLVFKFGENIGMLIVIMRGFYTCSSSQELIISQDATKLPFLLIRSLLSYLYRNDSAQLESGYLIIEFLIHLLKFPQNRAILQQLINHENQLYLLKTYINDGITSQLVINLIASLKNMQTISVIYSQILHGYIADESLPSLIAKCIESKAINPNQQQILQLCNVYQNKLDIVSDIIIAFLTENCLKNQQLIQLLNNNLSSRWIHFLIKQNILFNLKDTFLNTVRNIINVTYPSQLENQLVLPYSVLLANIEESIQLLESEGLFLPFLNKLYDYAKLFKGDHLKITTLRVFAQIAYLKKQWIQRVVGLFQAYGKIEVSEWEDEEEGQDLFGAMLTIVNEAVEKTFQYTFGQLSWDTNQVEIKINALKQMI